MFEKMVSNIFVTKSNPILTQNSSVFNLTKAKNFNLLVTLKQFAFLKNDFPVFSHLEDEAVPFKIILKQLFWFEIGFFKFFRAIYKIWRHIMVINGDNSSVSVLKEQRLALVQVGNITFRR